MLKKICSVSIITLICSGLAFAIQQAVEWSKLDSTDGRFSAVMPSQPKTGVSDVDSSVGTLKLYTFSASNNIGQFMLSYADYPNEATVAEQEAVLDGVISGVLKGLKAELVSQTKVTLKGYPGREMRATRMVEGSQMVFSWKVFLVGRRLYQLGVGTSKADAESPDIQKFFTSFQLVNSE
jgi:hypothetical protein